MSNIFYQSIRGLDIVPISDHFLKEGKVFLTGAVDSEQCNEKIRQLLYLEENDEIDSITIYIDSPGGEVTAGLNLYDMIRLISKPVKTVCIGTCASMGAILFLASDDRRMMQNGKLMIHDPAFGGKHDISYKKPHEIQAELNDLNQCREVLGKIISERTGKSLEEIFKVTENDAYFTAQEAIDFNLATKIIKSIKEIK